MRLDHLLSGKKGTALGEEPEAHSRPVGPRGERPRKKDAGALATRLPPFPFALAGA